VDTIGVALIGSGYIAHYHARGLAELPDVKVPALCSIDGKAGEEFADKYGIEEVIDQISSLLGRKDIQANL
jgi:predicted dehydrogenase